MADTKKEYTSNLHPKGDLGTTVYPNVKSENIIDKDTTAYTAGKVPDSSLVQKSLDSLGENLETTKTQVATNKKNIETLQGNYTGLQHQVNTNSSDIALTKTQVDTNKTNIATLQGDVSSLKSDNQTTKTTIVGLVSADTTNKANIAKNTQNIENLSKVMPTDINVDENGYAILEHDGTEITGQKKKVKFAQTDKKASFNEVTIPTASALKTKDGSSFGGGSEDDIFKISYSRFEVGNKVTLTADEILKYKKSSLVVITEYNGGSLSLLRSDGGDFQSAYTEDDRFITFLGILDNNVYSLSMQYVNLNEKYQLTLYRHTVKISKVTNDNKISISFTALSEKNTSIDSIQDLTTVFGNTNLSISGFAYMVSLSIWGFLTSIHVGTSISNTTIDAITTDGIDTTSFTDLLGTTGFTITDNVTAM